MNIHVHSQLCIHIQLHMRRHVRIHIYICVGLLVAATVCPWERSTGPLSVCRYQQSSALRTLIVAAHAQVQGMRQGGALSPLAIHPSDETAAHSRRHGLCSRASLELGFRVGASERTRRSVFDGRAAVKSSEGSYIGTGHARSCPQTALCAPPGDQVHVCTVRCGDHEQQRVGSTRSAASARLISTATKAACLTHLAWGSDQPATAAAPTVPQQTTQISSDTSWRRHWSWDLMQNNGRSAQPTGPGAPRPRSSPR